MFFTSYSLMLKAFFSPHLFFLPCFLSVAPRSAIAPESAAVPFLSLLGVCAVCNLFRGFLCIFFFLFHPQMNAGTFKFGTSGGHH